MGTESEDQPDTASVAEPAEWAALLAKARFSGEHGTECPNVEGNAALRGYPFDAADIDLVKQPTAGLSRHRVEPFLSSLYEALAFFDRTGEPS